MEVIKTKKIEIINVDKKVLNDTITIYNSALKFLIPIVEKHYQKTLNVKDRMKIIENLIHNTDKNNALYNFNDLFPKFPSYFRRSLIMDCIGILDSHFSRMDNWLNDKIKWESKHNINNIVSNNLNIIKQKNKDKKQQKRFGKKEPVLQYEPNNFPSFYEDNMFVSNNMGVYIKIYKDNDWKWLEIQLKDNNSNNYNTFLNQWKTMNPKLVRKHKYKFKYNNINHNNKSDDNKEKVSKNIKFYLHIPYKTNIKLKEKDKNEKQKICSVDLGLNTCATCVIMDETGTVLNRRFINLKREKDQIYTVMNRLKKLKRNSGNNQNFHLYLKLANLKSNYIHALTNKIIKFSVENNVDNIVIEHLGKMKGSGKIKEKLHHWAKKNIYYILKRKSHLNGIRINRINPNGTSKYAFDGSGEIIRGKKANDYLPENLKLQEELENNQILSKDNKCLTKQEKEEYYKKNKLIKIHNTSYGIFPSGKIYNIDLSAAYNIGSRYFYNKLIKPLSEKKRLIIEAKVPELLMRTTFTLSSLMCFDNFNFKTKKVNNNIINNLELSY